MDYNENSEKLAVLKLKTPLIPEAVQAMKAGVSLLVIQMEVEAGDSSYSHLQRLLRAYEFNTRRLNNLVSRRVIKGAVNSKGSDEDKDKKENCAPRVCLNLKIGDKIKGLPGTEFSELEGVVVGIYDTGTFSAMHHYFGHMVICRHVVCGTQVVVIQLTSCNFKPQTCFPGEKYQMAAFSLSYSLNFEHVD